MKRAEAKRELDALLSKYKPWDVIPDEQQDEIARLTKIAYPNGISLPRL